VDNAETPAASTILHCMPTQPPSEDADLSAVLGAYAKYPLADGDAVLLLLDTRQCVEIERLAAEWDEELSRNTAEMLRRSARRVCVAIARAHQELQPSDFQLWRDLHAELRDSEVELLPVRALPAA
jgi:hypothetical protein